VRRLWAAPKTIPIGVFPTFHLFHMAFDANIIASTLVVAALIIGLIYYLRRHVTSGVPGKLQLIYEILVVDMIGQLAESAIGPKYKKFVPLGMTLFLVILFSNWIGFLPTALHPGSSFDILPPPTSDVNLPLAMALFVVAWVHYESVRARGGRGYFRHYKQPYAILTPINVIEEVTKPITLTFRLFGNIFSGALMILVMTTLLPIYVVPFGEIIWKPFDLFIGALQAYIFMLLAILYFGMAMSHDEAPGVDHAHATEITPAHSTS
jgi:F-type H+-transporting ATPase subunit a